MTELRHQVRRAGRQLWLNRWFELSSWAGTVAIGLFVAVVFLVKMFGWDAPLGWIGLGLLAAALAVSTIWSHAVRADEGTAAAALDEAAGLRERISSGLYCEGADDPFARAVLADAERVGGSVSVRQHIPLRAPRPVVYTAISAAVAGIMLLLPSGWIEQSRAQADRREREGVQRKTIAVKKRIEQIKKQARTNPALKDLQADLEKLAQAPPADMNDPEAIRHEALKKIDKAADALKRKLGGARFDKVSEMKKMLRGVKTPGRKDTPASRLAQALAAGDFKAANEAIQALQARLAEMKDSPNAEAAEQLQKQLDRLARQLEKVADDKALRRKLEQAGVKKEDVDKMMQQLAKGNLSEIEKQLQKLGLPPSQLNSLLKQLAGRAAACSACRNMSGALGQASQALQQGQLGDAASGLAAAGDQLSEMEQLEQELNQLQSTIASLENARNAMDACPSCNGTGMQGGRPCGLCQGTGMNRGPGMGRLGVGRGGLAPEQETSVAFKAERTPVFTGPGKIIGQFLIDGDQVKGDASRQLVDVIAAEERNAADAINRDRIPRQYQRSVKEYFARVQRTLGENRQAAEDSETSSEDKADRTDDADANNGSDSQTRSPGE